MENEVKEPASKYNFILPEAYPQTERNDKGREFFYYPQIPSLKEYIMIDSQQKKVIISHKGSSDLWKFEYIHEPGGELIVHTIKSRLLLRDIYDGTGL